MIPEFHRVVIFLVLTGITIPSFSSFGYYFMIDIVKLSKLTIAMLNVLGFVCLLIGSALYSSLFATWEIRRLFALSFIIGVIITPFYLMFVSRKNLEYGIPDMALIVFSELIWDTTS